MKIWNRVKRCFGKFWAKRPRLIWYREECEVVIAFDLSKVSLQQVFKVEDALAELGVHFDRGAGCGERHWEWDYSLDGPVTVRFKRRGKRKSIAHLEEGAPDMEYADYIKKLLGEYKKCEQTPSKATIYLNKEGRPIYAKLEYC